MFHISTLDQIKIAYIGGGSQGWARSLMSDLSIDERMSGTVALYDLDFEAAQKNEVIGNHSGDGRWRYEAVSTLKKALSGADIVIISILPGSLEDMEIDVHFPERCGIYQSVGDTVGPGGIIRSLRAVPMFADIARAIRDYAPESWVINYTNPMSVCTRVLYKVFPGIKAIGCCHEVFGTQKLLAEMVTERLGVEVLRREDIRVNVLGINHFTWVTEASYRHIDLLPIFHEFSSHYGESGYELEGESWRDSVFRSAHRVAFDLFEMYSAIPAAGDRHLAEFLPGPYLKQPEVWKFHLTPVSFRKQDRDEKRKETEQLIAQKRGVAGKASGEEGVNIIAALLGLGELVTNVNVPNQGQVSSLPLQAIVETNALVTRNSVQPIFSGALPKGVKMLAARHVSNQEAVVEAGLTKDRGLAFQAFLNDPLVTLDRRDAEQLFDDMLLKHQPIL
ncbi:alpha-galacturonidase LplD [Bacillus spizizenii ATCC 6633 = JCM 2499]|uniref:Putative glycosidase n=1 Tax=Bacillus spizizenii (strain ATCC 23059 / NRRL B-14472 / W23) TaxID=655816 RepID=E0TUW5_BACSH|nr:alpha-galacturonidase LplD [Bacillus spizizenii]QCJ16069.1 alpha-glucosidase/alpha-galactosidase [Bacillus subtilis]ADM36783.1 putative glycosidase [Bacillus spizizenii str. W23]AJW86203.1 alpha-galacturonidase [Bacillus spizizenii]EFG93631.1 putative glycosidase [Bacillus spizizenii ATCC 6633 = JCM 2499]KFK80133.1 putative glucosidase lplD [Bacillus spizizenii]